MQINWQPNPLHTQILLDDSDLERLRLKVKLQTLEETLGHAAFRVRDDKHFDLDAVRKELAYERWCADDDEPEHPLNREIARFMGYYVHALAEEVHVGDCTCVPCSCTKCHAESLLGVDTIKGVGKHGLYKIDAAFDKKNDGSVSLDEAVRRMENYEPHATWAGWEAHAPRWRAEAARATEWLKAYRAEHFAETVDA